MDVNKVVNKVVLNGEILINLTEDTVTEEDVLNGKLFHKANGEQVNGTASLNEWDGTLEITEIQD